MYEIVFIQCKLLTLQFRAQIVNGAGLSNGKANDGSCHFDELVLLKLSWEAF